MKYWFKRKRYGWGWTPASWQGWLSIALWVAALLFLFVYTDARTHSASDTLAEFVIPAIILTAVLWAICWLKGPTPKWQWGTK